MTAQPVRQKRVRPLKVHNETQEKWVSGFFWPPEWLRDNCRANESRRPEQKTGRQWLPGSSQPRREEGLVFAFASLCGVLRGPQACLGPRIVEHYSMVPRPASSANPQEYSTVRGLESSDSSGLAIIRTTVSVPLERPVPESKGRAWYVLAIGSVFIYSPVVFG